MTLTIQVKLLRVLERMTFKRVGGTKDITVSVRVISATNQDLETMVREQRFREDLYYRLKVVPIRVPSLRERREDILPLARHFLEQFNRAFSKGFKSIDPEAERILLLVSVAGEHSRASKPVRADRPPEPGATGSRRASERRHRADSPQDRLRARVRFARWWRRGTFRRTGIDLEASLGAVEREIIQRAFDWTRGNQSRAATLLQMKRDKLRYRMKLYGFHDATSDLSVDD